MYMLSKIVWSIYFAKALGIRREIDSIAPAKDRAWAEFYITYNILKRSIYNNITNGMWEIFKPIYYKAG